MSTARLPWGWSSKNEDRNQSHHAERDAVRLEMSAYCLREQAIVALVLTMCSPNRTEGVGQMKDLPRAANSDTE